MVGEASIVKGSYAGYSTSKKPTCLVEIDWSNPLTEGLVGCWLFNTGVNVADSESKVQLDLLLAGDI